MSMYACTCMHSCACITIAQVLMLDIIVSFYKMQQSIGMKQHVHFALAVLFLVFDISGKREMY